MYAILIEDFITEHNKVMTTLATDLMAANTIMLAVANGWCAEQPVGLGYILEHQPHEGAVMVLAGTEKVLRVTACSILSCISSAEISTFVDGIKPTEH